RRPAAVPVLSGIDPEFNGEWSGGGWVQRGVVGHRGVDGGCNAAAAVLSRRILGVSQWTGNAEAHAIRTGAVGSGSKTAGIDRNTGGSRGGGAKEKTCQSCGNFGNALHGDEMESAGKHFGHSPERELINAN